MYFVLIGLLLSAEGLDVPNVGQRIIVELRNGYRVEGQLIEKDHRAVVLRLESGEMRFDLKSVERFHVPETREPAVEEPGAPRTRVEVTVPPDGDRQRRLVLSFPPAWKKVEDTSGALVYSGAQEDMRFRVEDMPQAHSLWRITAKIRSDYKRKYPGFKVKQERFGNRWESVRTWEIDFEYVEGEQRMRERRLILDFGAVKQVLSFRTQADRFPGLIGHFDSVTSGLKLQSFPRARVKKPDHVAPPPTSSGDSKAIRPFAEESLESLENSLDEVLRDAFEG